MRTASTIDAVRGGRRDAVEPRAHRHDVRRRRVVRREPVTFVPCTERRVAELDPRIGAAAAEEVDAVVELRQRAVRPEPVRREVDRPQHD
jgi:hypothetical protein